MNKRRVLAQRGFSLIEVLVSLLLLSIMGLMAWRGLAALDLGSARLQARAQDSGALMRVFGQLQRDLQLQAGADVLAAWPLALQRPTPGKQLLARTPGLAWDDAQGLQLVRAAGDGLWQRVNWYLADGALHRAVGAPSLALPLPSPAAPERVLERVSAWSLRVWQPGQNWQAAGKLTEMAQNLSGKLIDGARVAPNTPAAAAPGALGLEFVLSLGGAARAYRLVLELP